jgi:hypothetical protein
MSLQPSTDGVNMEIWKFPLGDGMAQDIEMPMHAEILTVQVQHGHVCLWAKVAPENVKKPRRIHIVGTGHEVPKGAFGYIGTVQQGVFVWHIFEEYL